MAMTVVELLVLSFSLGFFFSLEPMMREKQQKNKLIFFPSLAYQHTSMA
jgi:hypothetical protein